MNLTAFTTIIPVALVDAEGHATGQHVPVTAEYVQEADYQHGADADGRRGEMRVSYTVLDAYIEASDLKQVIATQAAWAIEEATVIFHSRQKHW